MRALIKKIKIWLAYKLLGVKVVEVVGLVESPVSDKSIDELKSNLVDKFIKENLIKKTRITTLFSDIHCAVHLQLFMLKPAIKQYRGKKLFKF